MRDIRLRSGFAFTVALALAIVAPQTTIGAELAASLPHLPACHQGVQRAAFLSDTPRLGCAAYIRTDRAVREMHKQRA